MDNKFIRLQDGEIINNFIQDNKLENNKDEFRTFRYQFNDKLKKEILDKLNGEILNFLNSIKKTDNSTSDIIKIYLDKKFEINCGIDIIKKTEEICKYSFQNLTYKKLGDIIKYMIKYKEASNFFSLSNEEKDAIYNMFRYLENSELRPKNKSIEDFYENILTSLVEIFNANNEYYLGYLQIKYINYQNNIKILEGLLGNLDLTTRQDIIEKYNLNFG